MDMLLSIITVTYNAASTLPATLTSVAAQTCRDFEHIIVDGASKDNTVALARQAGYPELVVNSEPDRGIYDAMNRGLGMARGEYVLFLNAGDRLHAPDTVARIVEAARDNNTPGIIYGYTDIIGVQGNRLGDRHLMPPMELTLKSFADGMVVCHQSFVALRRIAVDFDLRWRLSGDYEWCIHCLQHSRHNVMLHCVISDYLYEGATTRNRWRSLRERFLIMARHYGWFPTIARHLKFIPRFLRRRRIEKSWTTTA